MTEAEATQQQHFDEDLDHHLQSGQIFTEPQIWR